MTAFRTHLDRVEAAGDLLRIDERVHWAGDARTIAAEAARTSGPALLFADTPGNVRLASGCYGGPDGMCDRDRTPWSRLAIGLGRGADCGYVDLLDALANPPPGDGTSRRRDLAAAPVETDLYSLGLPTVGTDDVPTVTLGVLAATLDGTTAWVPVRGSIHGGSRLRAAVPAAASGWLDDRPVSLALGVPVAALVTASAGWLDDGDPGDAPRRAQTLDDVAVGAIEDRLVPATAEVVLDGVATTGTPPTGRTAAWERATDTAAIEVSVETVATRDDPVVPFAPLGAPLADDLALAGLVEAARLYRRVNHYWGVAPVEWIALPPETGLGMCLVASEILYAGFEWQLANTLFAFSRLFDKVLVLDGDTPPADLATAFDDMWVKANPAHDWEFSERDAPAATAPAYRPDGATGSRVYINAAWDPRWDEEYIAPRVTFEESYPEEVREAVIERWSAFGFRSDGRE